MEAASESQPAAPRAVVVTRGRALLAIAVATALVLAPQVGGSAAAFALLSRLVLGGTGTAGEFELRFHSAADGAPQGLPIYPLGTWREWAAADLAPVLRAASAAAGDAADPPPPPGVPMDANASFRWLASLRCTPAFVGTECPPGDVLTNTSALRLRLPEKYGVPDPDSLPRAVALRGFLNGTGCATWRRGVFTPCGRINDLQWAPATQAAQWPHTRWFQPALPPLPASHPAVGAGLPLCRLHNPDTLSDGDIDEDTRLWTPRRCRLPYRFPHDLLHRCLRGKRLMLVGDSPLRQMAARFVAFVRGQPLVMEHDFGFAITYSWDGVRDEWRVHHAATDERGTRTDSVNVTGMRRGADLPDDPDAFYLLRNFQSRLDLTQSLRSLVDAFQPTHLVLGSNYWIRTNESEASPARVTRTVLSLLTQLHQGGARDSTTASKSKKALKGAAGDDASQQQQQSGLAALYWYTFPCHPPPSHYKKVHERRDERTVAALRRAWAHPPKAAAAAVQRVPLGFLPTCAAARAGVSTFSTDTVHLACRYDPAPRPDGTAYPQTGMKNTVDNDCSMGVELTNIRALLAGMCPEQFPDPAEAAAAADGG